MQHSHAVAHIGSAFESSVRFLGSLCVSARLVFRRSLDDWQKEKLRPYLQEATELFVRQLNLSAFLRKSCFIRQLAS